MGNRTGDWSAATRLLGPGWTTGDVHGLIDGPEDLDTAADAADSDYWIDLATRDRMRFAAPLNLRLWDKPVTETELLKIPGLEQLEVIRMRQASNPSWISTEQLSLLEPLLPEWPEIGPPVDEVLTIERNKCGWDLTCMAPDGTVHRVEVKGVSGAKPIVLLTRNEYRSSQEDTGWVLAVTRALTAPNVAMYNAQRARSAAEPYVYQLDLSHAPPPKSPHQ